MTVHHKRPHFHSEMVVSSWIGRPRISCTKLSYFWKALRARPQSKFPTSTKLLQRLKTSLVSVKLKRNDGLAGYDHRPCGGCANISAFYQLYSWHLPHLKMDDDQQWLREGGFLLSLSKSSNSRKAGTSPAVFTHINWIIWFFFNYPLSVWKNWSTNSTTIVYAVYLNCRVY